MNDTVAIVCSKMLNLEKILNESLKKMLTESCVMFFSPSRAVLSVILRDEYLTRGVTWVFFGWVCAARDSKMAPRSGKNFP